MRTCTQKSMEPESEPEPDVVEESETCMDDAEAGTEAGEDHDLMLETSQAQDFCLESIPLCFLLKHTMRSLH